MMGDEPIVEAIKEHLTLREEVIGNDETGMRIDGKLYWLQTTGTRHELRPACLPSRGQQQEIAWTQFCKSPGYARCL